MTITRRFEVTVTKEITVNLPDWFDTKEFIDDWKTSLWEISGIDDIAEYAARCAATCSSGEFDGLGKLGAEYVKDADVTFKVEYDDIDASPLEIEVKLKESSHD